MYAYSCPYYNGFIHILLNIHLIISYLLTFQFKEDDLSSSSSHTDTAGSTTMTEQLGEMIIQHSHLSYIQITHPYYNSACSQLYSHVHISLQALMTSPLF